MARIENDIMGIEGRVGGLTTYIRNGKKYVRVSTSHQPRRLSRQQLLVRERQSHNNALWRALKAPATIPALLTDLTPKDAKNDTFLLYVLHQKVITHQNWPDQFYLSIKAETLTKDDFTLVSSTLLSPYKNAKGTLALIGPRFDDPMLGFALVRLKDGHASRQHVVTRCTYYERFTTEETLQTAAKSYGGLTGEDTFL